MTKRRTLPALLAATFGIGAGFAFAGQPTQADLQAQIQQLQAQVSQMQTQRNTSAFSAKDVDSTVDSVLRDADRRSVLLAETGGVMAGWMDNGIHIRSADGNNDFQPYFQFDFRSVTNLGDFSDDTSSSDGFEIRRMKMGFKGTAISPKLKYDFRWASDRSGGGLTLENAFITYQFADNFAFKVGQWKDNVFHEETTSSTRQLAVDRSYLNEVLAGGLTDYVQGAALLYDAGNMRAEIAYHDGANSDNTNFVDAGSNFGVSVRVEGLLNGDWKAYEDFSAMNNKKDLLVVGGGVDWTQSGDTNTYFHTLDVQWENTTGLGIYGAFIGRYVEFGSDTEVYDWGFLVQAGYMLDKQLELFGRYDMTVFDSDQANGEDTVHEVTVGINYYLKGHSAKVTIDATWLPNGAPSSVSGIGILGQGDDDNQFLIRGQFQLTL